MRILLNGEPCELEPPATVASAVAAAGSPAPAEGIAVAVEGEVVPRGRWDEHRLDEGQRVEVVRAVQGG